MPALTQARHDPAVDRIVAAAPETFDPEKLAELQRLFGPLVRAVARAQDADG